MSIGIVNSSVQGRVGARRAAARRVRAWRRSGARRAVSGATATFDKRAGGG
jgi:hypothetical protein